VAVSYDKFGPGNCADDDDGIRFLHVGTCPVAINIAPGPERQVYLVVNPKSKPRSGLGRFADSCSGIPPLMLTKPATFVEWAG